MKTNDELFELCEEVKRVTDWGVGFDDDGIGTPPLYTSDYLLEKLQDVEPRLYFAKKTATGRPKWFITCDSKEYQGFVSHADTPLKSLLKLTLALHEAGQLNQQQPKETEE
jgi:hypothetical protein